MAGFVQVWAEPFLGAVDRHRSRQKRSRDDCDDHCGNKNSWAERSSQGQALNREDWEVDLGPGTS